MDKSFYHHPRLNAHKGIGIDIDHTLINGPGSFFLQNWVRDHYKDLDLHLITFRDGIDFDLIRQDIGEFGMELDMFRGVHGIPAETSRPFWKLMQKVGERGTIHEPKWLRGLKHHKSSVEEYETLYTGVSMWKGSKCKELGLTALIDDLATMVLPGCEAHGVEFIDALKLNQPTSLDDSLRASVRLE